MSASGRCDGPSRAASPRARLVECGLTLQPKLVLQMLWGNGISNINHNSFKPSLPASLHTKSGSHVHAKSRALSEINNCMHLPLKLEPWSYGTTSLWCCEPGRNQNADHVLADAAAWAAARRIRSRSASCSAAAIDALRCASSSSTAAGGSCPGGGRRCCNCCCCCDVSKGDSHTVPDSFAGDRKGSSKAASAEEAASVPVVFAAGRHGDAEHVSTGGSRDSACGGAVATPMALAFADATAAAAAEFARNARTSLSVALQPDLDESFTAPTGVDCVLRCACSSMQLSSWLQYACDAAPCRGMYASCPACQQPHNAATSHMPAPTDADNHAAALPGMAHYLALTSKYVCAHIQVRVRNTDVAWLKTAPR
eukprot:363335-Chlamydomonas_euryale.AAC.3